LFRGPSRLLGAQDDNGACKLVGSGSRKVWCGGAAPDLSLPFLSPPPHSFVILSAAKDLTSFFSLAPLRLVILERSEGPHFFLLSRATAPCHPLSQRRTSLLFSLSHHCALSSLSAAKDLTSSFLSRTTALCHPERSEGPPLSALLSDLSLSLI